MFPRKAAHFAWLLGYLAMVAVIVLGLQRYRGQALNHYGTENAGANWREWREDAEKLGKTGPVERDAPASAEPPALVLMRDHYAACLGISLLLSSCLFVWFMFSVQGAMKPVELHFEPDERAPDLTAGADGDPAR